MIPTDFTPRPEHLLWPAFFIVAGSLLLHNIGLMAIGLFILGVLAVIWIVIAGLWIAKAAFNESVAAVAHEIKDMDPEQYRALGLQIPELHIYPARGEPVAYLEETEIRMDLVRMFIADSDEYQFAPERLYGEGTRKRRQWAMLRDWLIDNNYVIDNSNAGNHSWQWRSGRRALFMRNYLGQDPLSMLNLNEEEANGD